MATLGDMLYQARKEAGYSLPDIAHMTRIRLPYLEALESGSYDVLPATGYVRGFINSYTHALGRDPQEFLAQYEKDLGINPHEQTLERPLQADVAVPAHNDQHTINWRVAIVIVAIIAVIAIAIWLALSLSGSRKNDVDPTPVTPASVETSVVPDANTDTTNQSQTGATPFNLKVTVDQDAATEVKVTVDGDSAYDGVLTGSNKLDFEVVDKAIFVVANPDVVSVTKDGVKQTFPDGKNVKLTLKAE